MYVDLLLQWPKIKSGNYRMIGSVTQSVCVSVCLSLPLLSGMERPRSLMFDSMVGYGSGTKSIDFMVNQCIFKVSGDESLFPICFRA